MAELYNIIISFFFFFFFLLVVHASQYVPVKQRGPRKTVLHHV